MANKLLIILQRSDPREPVALVAPFEQAMAAAAMEYEVEIIFSGLAGQLAVRGVAESLGLPPKASRTLYDMIRDAHEAGVKFKASTDALETWGRDLIPEIEEPVGQAYVISEAMDDETVTFTY